MRWQDVLRQADLPEGVPSLSTLAASHCTGNRDSHQLCPQPPAGLGRRRRRKSHERWHVGSEEQEGTERHGHPKEGSQGEAHGESAGAREMEAGPLMRAGRVLWGRGVGRGQRMAGMLRQGRQIWRWAPCSHWAALVRWPGLCPGYCLRGQAAHVCVRPTVTESHRAGLPGHMPATPHSSRWVPKCKGIPVSKQGCGEQPGLLPGPGQAHTSPGSGPQRPPPWLPFLPSYPLYTASKGVFLQANVVTPPSVKIDPSLAPCGPQDKALL